MLTLKLLEQKFCLTALMTGVFVLTSTLMMNSCDRRANVRTTGGMNPIVASGGVVGPNTLTGPPRWAVVLTSDDNCGVGLTPQATGMNRQPALQVTRSGNVSGLRQTGQVRVLRIDDVSGQGFVTGEYQVLSGVSPGSQAKISPDGSTVLVSTPNDPLLYIYHLSQNGSLTSHQPPIAIGAGQTALDIANIPNIGQVAAVSHGSTLTLLRGDRPIPFAGNETFVGYSGARANMPSVGPQSRIVSLVFSPHDPNYLYLLVQATANRGSYVTSCYVPELLENPVNPYNAHARMPQVGPRGCSIGPRSTPDAYQGNLDPYGVLGRPWTIPLGGRSPVKLVSSSDQFLVALEGELGPTMLWPGTGEHSEYHNQMMAPGHAGINVISQRPDLHRPGQRSFKDVAVHPISHNIVALTGNSLNVYSTDNRWYLGEIESTYAFNNPVALALDPGDSYSDGTLDPARPGSFALVASQGDNRVHILGMDNRAVYSRNPMTDFIQLPCRPVALDIRTRSDFSMPPVSPES